MGVVAPTHWVTGWLGLSKHPAEEQLRLPFDVPGSHAARLRERAATFIHDFAPKAESKVLMRLGVPMVAATTPAVLDLLDTDGKHSLIENLVTGSGLGGAWGAVVGAAIPSIPAGQARRRLHSSAKGAAAGIVLAPAVAIVSKYVVDWATRPLRRDLEVKRAADQ